MTKCTNSHCACIPSKADVLLITSKAYVKQPTALKKPLYVYNASYKEECKQKDVTEKLFYY